MLIIRSFVKTKERLEKEQAVIQAVEKASTENNEQELLASYLLVSPQQSAGFGTLYYEVVFESMTNENTKAGEIIPNSLMLIVSKLDNMLVKIETRKL